MKYISVNFKITVVDDSMLQASRDVLADSVGSIGFESFEDTQNGIKGYIKADLYDEKELEKVIKNFIIPNVSITYNTEDIEDRDWNEEWEKAGFEPIRIGDRCVIYDAKNQKAPSNHSDGTLYIGIEAKQAFGTGTHETTQMVVSTLLDTLLQGKNVLDCGCGTGILGIVAAKLGAKHVTAYDIDEWCIRNTMHNAKINSVDNIDTLEGDSRVLSHVSGLFDVVVANINRSILLADMHAFADMMHNGSELIVSGFYSSDAPLLVSKANELGMQEALRKANGDWCCIKFINNMNE